MDHDRPPILPAFLGSVTRRGTVAGIGLLATALLEMHAAVASKKKKRKKRRRRCHKLTEDCGKGKTRRCCSGLRCDAVDGLGTGKQCCLQLGKSCRDKNDCCGVLFCDALDSRCCRGLGQSCTGPGECCSLLACLGSTCQTLF
jgi:hypothetical protein